MGAIRRSYGVDELLNLFLQANEMFLKKDIELLLLNVSERSWYSRFATYLEDLRKKYHLVGYRVDTEYNRSDAGKIKSILDNHTFQIIPITCDIILHSGGKNKFQDNLLCIEMKKSTALKKEKLEDKKRLSLLTKVSFDDVWSADGKALPEHVCGNVLGIYYEVNEKKRFVYIETYWYGAKTDNFTISF